MTLRPANTITRQAFFACFPQPEAPRPRSAKPRKTPAAAPARPLPPQKPALPRDKALELIDRLMQQTLPPPYNDTVRVHPPGDCLCRMVLDAALCRTTNRRRLLGGKADPAKTAKFLGLLTRERGDLLASMTEQWTNHSTHPDRPLKGRPWVRCILFTSHEHDPGCGFEKLPIDCLQEPRKLRGKLQGGMFVIKNDRRKYLARAVWEEPWPKEWADVVLLEVWSGDPWALPGGRKRKDRNRGV